jgi:hypothetical protein
MFSAMRTNPLKVPRNNDVTRCESTRKTQFTRLLCYVFPCFFEPAGV